MAKSPSVRSMTTSSAGKWVAPVEGRYFDNMSPITGKQLCEVARSTAEDIELALDAAHKAKEAWGKTSPAERAQILNKIADRMEENLDLLALVETLDNGKPIRETTACRHAAGGRSFPLFRRRASAPRKAASPRSISDTVAYHSTSRSASSARSFPWNFPLLMAAWKLAPALAAGNCVVLKPAEQTPLAIMVCDGADRRHPAAGRAQHRQRLRRRSRQAARLRTSASPRSPSPARRRPAG